MNFPTFHSEKNIFDKNLLDNLSTLRSYKFIFGGGCTEAFSNLLRDSPEQSEGEDQFSGEQPKEFAGKLTVLDSMSPSKIKRFSRAKRWSSQENLKLLILQCNKDKTDSIYRHNLIHLELYRHFYSFSNHQKI